MNCTFEELGYIEFLRSVQPRSSIVVIFDNVNVTIVVVVRSNVSNGDNFVVVDRELCFANEYVIF